MSTSTSPPQRRSTPPPSGVLPDRFIELQLDRTRRDVKLVDLSSAVMVLAAGVVGFLLVAAVIDHWVLPLAPWGRWLFLAALLLGVAWYGATVLAPLVLRRINPIYAARTIEQSEPSLRNSVINFLLFREDRAGLRVGVYEALKQRAATDLTHVRVEAAVDRTQLIHVAYGLTAMLVLLAGYTILSPRSPFQTARRVAAPWADIAQPARVRIDHVEPGTREVYYGQRVRVSADCEGLYADEPVNLIYSSLDGRISQQSVPMQADAARLRFDGGLPPGEEGIQQDLVYRIEAGDAQTPSYRLTVLPAPTLLVQQVEYEYPDYTQLPKRIVQRQGDVRGVEGTRVTVRAQASQPIRWAALVFAAAPASSQGKAADSASPPETAAAPDSVTMTFDGQQAQASLVLQWDAAAGRAKYPAYQLRFETQDGHRNLHAPLYRIDVTRDLSPEIEILTPDRDRIELPADRPQQIEVRAIDPDYALRTIDLRAVAGGAELLSANLLDDEPGRTGQVVGTYRFQPWEHGLNPGDTLDFWAVAADNRISPQTGQPEPNVAKTRNYRITILPPENPPDAAPPGEPERPNEEPAPEDANPTPEAGQKSQNGSPDDSSAPEPAAKEQEQGSADSKQESGGSPSAPDDSGGQDGSGGSAGSSGSQAAAGQSQPSAGQQGGAGQSPSPDSSGESGESSGEQGGSSTGEPRSSDSDGAEPGESGQGGEQSAGSGSAGGPSSAGAGGEAGEGQQESSSGGTAAATGKQAAGDEPLHDGEVVEKTLDYIQQQRAEAAGQQAGGEGGGEPKPATAGEQQTPAGSAGQSPEARAEQAGPPPGAEEASGESPRAPSGGAPEKPSASPEAQQQQPGAPPTGGGQQGGDRNQGAGQQQEANAGEGGKPQGGAETRPEASQGEKPSGEPRQGGLGDTGDSGDGQTSEDRSGSPQAQGKNADIEKTSQTGDGQKQSSEGAQSPSKSKKQRNLKGGAGGDESGEGNRGGGQGSGQEGNDSPGGHSSADDGSGASQESGSGDTAKRPGDRQTAEDPTNTPGTQKGPGSSTQAAPGSQRPGGKSDTPQPSENADRSAGQPTSGPSGESGQGAPLGGGRPGAADLGGFDMTGEVPPGEEPNLEYARRSTEMVLEYLRDQQQKPDPKLLEELGWEPEDLQGFLERWDALRRQAGPDGSTPQVLDEALRSLGLRPQQGGVRRTANRPDDFRGLEDTGTHASPPARYLEQFNAYKKGTARADE